MAYAILLIELLALFPLASILRKTPRYIPMTWFAIGFLMFMYPGWGPLGLSVYSWPVFVGHTKGIEITIIDILAAALFIAGSGDKTMPKPPFRPAMAAYFLVALSSLFYAFIPMAAAFYVCQLLRMYFFYIVVFRGSRDPQNIDYLLRGLALGLLVEFLTVFYQKFAGGNIGPPGTFVHRNALGLVINLAVLPLISLVLASRVSKLISLGTVTGLMATALLASRATIGLAAIGTLLVYVFSVMRKGTSRKARFGLVGVALAVIMVPIAMTSLSDRKIAQGNTFGDSEYDERAAFIQTASMMLQDHPLGVGANNFVLIANMGDYFARAGVAPSPGSRSAHVHNIYWLTLAELGYLGFLALIWMFAAPLATALRSAWRHRDSTDGDLMAGLAMALVTLYIHSYYEWTLATGVAQYFLAATWGMVGGLARKLEAPRQVRAPVPQPKAVPVAATRRAVRR